MDPAYAQLNAYIEDRQIRRDGKVSLNNAKIYFSTYY